MVKINQLDENLNIEGKRVLLRVDFNVPINGGSITENSRIEKVLPTIKLAKKLGPGNTIVTILCDHGKRYASKIFNKEFLKTKNLPIPSWL